MQSLVTNTSQTDTSQANFLKDVVSNFSRNSHQSYVSELNFLNQFTTATYAETKGEVVTADDLIDDALAQHNTTEVTTSMLRYLQRYLNWRSESLEGSTLRGVLTILKNYTYYKGVRIMPADYKSLKLPMIVEHEKHNFDHRELEMIFRVARGDRAAYYAALASGGMRGAECLQLTKEDMRLSNVDGVQRFFCTMVAETTKMRRTRETIISAEATDFILPRWDACEKSDLVYLPTLKTKRPKDRRSHAGEIFSRDLDRAGLGTLTPRPTPHRLRSYFKGVADVHKMSEWAHRLMGHKGNYLPTYGGLKRDSDKLAYYVQVEPELTIMDAAVVRAQVQRKNLATSTEIESLKEQVRQLQEKGRHEGSTPAPCIIK